MSGGAGADTILGHGGHDHLDGGSDDDMILGGSGNDTLHGGIGDDTIDGGDNADTAVFTGAWSDYTITETGGIYTVADNRPDSPDGTDTLTNVELFHFADGSVAPADALNGGPRVNATNGTVTENDAGAVIGAVSGTDPDAGDSVTLSVDDARFEIVDDQLKLKTGESLDYEDGATVNVTVTATDLHGATDTQVVTVTVGDLGETITLDDGGETFTDTGVAETSITGGSGDDVITAHDDGGVIDGAAGGDTLIGGAGDDTMSGGAGADVLDGGSGYDTAIWDGDLADFDIAYDANTQTFKISDQNTSDDDEGTDFVTNVETFNFNGTTHTAAEMIAEAGRQANEAPTDISFSAVGDLRGGASTIEETVVTGEIQETGTYTTVDHWEITHNGGDLTIDVLTKGTEYEGLDSRVRLFLDNGDGTFTQIAENDDGAAGSDGSTSSYDSLISATDLSAGTYVLAIGSYPMSERQAIRTDTDYSQTSGTGGAYQITFTGNAAVEVAENPTYGGAWGDPTDVGTVARTTHETSGFERGTPVARVSSVRDANEGDTHSYALSNDADGTFAIDANSGAISLTADPRDEGTSQDTITVVATDQYGESHNETISLTFGNNADNSLLGTENNDIIYGFDGENTLQGGAGNDTIVGGVSDSLAVESIVADNGTNVHGTTGRDFYSWTAETGESATIRFNYSPSSANDGDGVFDYVVVETTEGDTKLTIGDFDFGVDQVVLQEAYESISVYGFSNGAVYDVTYRNGNTQTFTIYGVDGASAPEDIFTTVMPDTEYSGGDTAVYSGDASDFDVTYDAATGAFVIIDQNTRDGLDEGTDVVTGVETFSFNGVEISASDLMGTDTTPTENPDFDTAERDATHAGDSGNNEIWATSSDDVIYGLAGNDRIGGQAGDDVVYGGSGNDQLHGNDGADTLYGGSGDDVAYAHTGNDVVYGDGGNDTLHGIEGEDTVFGGSGEDLIYGGDDADQLFGNADTDKIHGEAGNDTIVGGTGADVLHGGRDDDPISGGSGNDSLVGDSGNDTFSYAALGGADTINGGSGWTDVIELAGFGGNVTIEDSTVEGYGWTLVFDQDYTATAETLNSLDLGSDASGVITFDDGGTIDFTGIDKINF
jgi:Ca2+-binding RTX toxin-like protein